MVSSAIFGHGMLTAVASVVAFVFFASALFAEGEAPDAPFSAKRNDAWKIIGPGGGGAQFNPAIGLHTPERMFVSSDMTCSFVSDDGGDTWRMFNLRGVTRFFALDPSDGDTVYARSVGLFRSRDGGTSWELVYPAPENVERFVTVGDHGEERIITRDGTDETIVALAVDPAESRTLYGAFAAGGETDFRVSRDFGKTWEKSGKIPGAAKIYVAPASPKEDRTVYVVTRNSVSVREAGEWTNHKAPEGVQSFNSVSAAFPRGAARPVIYGVSGRAWRSEGSVAGVFRSDDGGATWRKIDADMLSKVAAGSAAPSYQAIAAAPSQPETAYLSYKDLREGPERNERYIGVAKTTDGGKTWELVWKESDTPAANMKSAWLNLRFGPWWGENPFALDVAAGDPDICIGTDFGRTMRTADGGKTWEAVYSRQLEDGSWSTTGLDVTCCYAVHFDPFDAKHMFISYTDIGMMESRNGGTGWLSGTADGIPKEWDNATYWLEFDPEVEGLVWAATSGVHDLPRPKMWRGRSAGSFSGGVCVSTDGGRTWQVSDSGIGQAAVTQLRLDPKSPSGSRTIYASSMGKGIFKSRDNGKTWQARNAGIRQSEPLVWRILLTEDSTLYAVVFRRSEDGSIGNENDGALYRSTDGADSWQEMALPEGVNCPSDIAVDTKDASRLCLSTWGLAKGDGDTGGGIFISTDAGKTWKRTLERDRHIHDLTIDKRNNVYYACGHDSMAWRSADAGETWKRIKGYNFKWGRKVVPDPNDAEMVYISTFGGSVWYGPAKGDEDALEDIATPEAKLCE